MNNILLSNTIRAFFQPHKTSVVADWGAAVDSVYTLGFNAKGAKLSAATAGVVGVLEVHLVDDAASRWYLLDLDKGVPSGAIFDKIRTTNTTVTVADVTIFPM